MKNRFILFCFLCMSCFSFAQVAFVFTVNVYNNNKNITLIATESYTYNYAIDWGDGTSLGNVTQSAYHVYPNQGSYTIVITGDFPHLNLELDNDVQITNVVQWGVNSWRSMENSFRSNPFLVIGASDAPDLSQVTSLSGMFYNCINVNSSFNNWDVSNITIMKDMFYDARLFNQPLDNWDVSNVTNMQNMFYKTESFNQPLNDWDVSNVTNMQQLFYEAESFNQSLDSWDVSSVENMNSMFGKASVFNGAVSNWDVSNVTNMAGMFSAAFAFNQSLNNWDISNVTSIGSMFFGAISFNQPLDNWDISNYTTMQNMFKDARQFNQPLDNWDVSNVTNMQDMFNGAREFNQPINNWDVSNVTNMQDMFNGAHSFNQPLDNWNVSNVTNMQEMFKDAESFNGGLNSWDVSNVENVLYMFNLATSFNQPLNNWELSSITNMFSMFRGATSFNQPLNNWDISNVTTIRYMFSEANSFNQPLNDWDFSSVLNFNFFLDNTNLDVVNYDSLLNALVLSGQTNETLGAIGLKYCNIDNRDYLINTLGWTISGDDISQSCSNRIFGSVLYDFDGAGCVSSEIFNNIFINATYNNYEFSTPVDENGNYSFYVYGDTVDVTLSSNISDYFTVNPESQSVTFDGVNNEEQVDFCISANETVNDLNIRLLPLDDARPGFEADYKMLIENIGTETIDNVLVTLTYDDAMQSFVSSVPTATISTVNSLDFELGTLLPFETQEITFIMQTFPPPTVNGDEVLNFTALVSPDTNDNTPNDNSFSLEQIVVNSFDPNDKRVLQGNTIHIDETSEYLDYIIRFQNTGTASAINIRVEDELHPNLDWSTLSITSVSHDFIMQITDQNKLKFIFDNIDLPFEADNEPASHGYIAYKIKPKTDIEIGDFMIGDAAIFFDFNAPIITNTVSTEVIDIQLGVAEFNLGDLLSVYPNPADDKVFFKTKESVTIESIKLFNIQGSELLNLRENFNYIETKNLPSGIYLLDIETNKGIITKKLIIK